METWQVVLVVLASALAGALLPAFLMLALALFRAARRIESLGDQLEPTLAKVQIIATRVETLSRGLEGGEKNVADLLSVIGDLAHGVERNLRMINAASAILAAAAPAVAAFVQAMRAPEAHEEAEGHTSGP
jgi:hypothetical protein